MRDMLLVSHANPEDNGIAQWLALQLAKEGYPVWCDLTKLLGGEIFWEDIQDAIKTRTLRFLFILSTTSNQKQGTLDELDCALGVAKQHPELGDFILPLRVDNLAHNDIYIGIRRRIAINFTPSWAQGLHDLLRKLEDDKVPKKAEFAPGAVTRWWRDAYSSTDGVEKTEEEVLSNWFSAILPENIFLHYVSRTNTGKIDISPEHYDHPAVKCSDLSFLSFAEAKDFAQSLKPFEYIAGTKPFKVVDVLAGNAPEEFQKHLAQLMRLAWEGLVRKRGMGCHDMAGKSACFYFTKGMVPKDQLPVPDRRSPRSIIGYRTIGKGVRFWHYGIQAKPVLRPEPYFMVKAHVIFSDDGTHIWESKDRLARARRSQCKNWWNDEWRDRLLGVMQWLSSNGTITLPVSPTNVIKLSAEPQTYVSPVTYRSSGERVDEVLDDEDFDDEEGDEDEE
jgi:hypothetical protein